MPFQKKDIQKIITDKDIEEAEKTNNWEIIRKRMAEYEGANPIKKRGDIPYWTYIKQSQQANLKKKGKYPLLLHNLESIVKKEYSKINGDYELYKKPASDVLETPPDVASMVSKQPSNIIPKPSNMMAAIPKKEGIGAGGNFGGAGGMIDSIVDMTSGDFRKDNLGKGKKDIVDTKETVRAKKRGSIGGSSKEPIAEAEPLKRARKRGSTGGSSEELPIAEAISVLAEEIPHTEEDQTQQEITHARRARAEARATRSKPPLIRKTGQSSEDISQLPNLEPGTVSINKAKPINLNKQIVSKIEPSNIPTTIDQIPIDKLSSDNKDEKQLRLDINYFFKNFPKPLANLTNAFKTINKMSLQKLIRFHKRIVGILQPTQPKPQGKVGVVIDAEEYIKKIVGETMIQKALEGYSIPNLTPIGTDTETKDETKKNIKDIGSYEVKRGPDGGLNSQKEPIYRYIPTTQEENIEESKYNYKQPIKRLTLPISKMRNRVVTAGRQVRTNPFLERKMGHRLQVIL